jgi:predicted nucleic acid-binding protein
MPHYFLDTSALVKYYHPELGSEEVSRILAEPGSVCSIARLTLTEMASVFAKKVRVGEIRSRDFELLRLRFLADVRSRLLLPLRILNGHFELAGDLIARHGKMRQIHPLDALQLAVALSARSPTPVDHFVSADQRFLNVAALEGCPIINPEAV